jgi:hypothetical protein
LAYFKDAQDVYDTVGKLFQDLAEDEELAPKFRKANTIVQYVYSEPDSVITVRLQEGQPGDVDLGETEMDPEVTMNMKADTAPRPRLEDPQARAAHQARVPTLQGDAGGPRPKRPDRRLMKVAGCLFPATGN